MTKLFFAVFFISFFAAQGWAEEAAFGRVTEVSGKVECSSPGNISWRPLAEGASLKKGSRIRTSEKSFVQISFDTSFHIGLRLMPGSRMEIVSLKPLKIFLEKGESLFLWESEIEPPIQDFSKHPEPLIVLTRDTSVKLSSGGFGAVSYKEGTLLRVYSEGIQWSSRWSDKTKKAPRAAEEGFRYWVPARSGKISSRRMNYSDYIDWQEWMKSFMQMRDDAMMPS